MMKKIDQQQPIKAVNSLSRSSVISIIALVVSTLLVMSGWVFYNHHLPHLHHRQLSFDDNKVIPWANRIDIYNDIPPPPPDDIDDGIPPPPPEEPVNAAPTEVPTQSPVKVKPTTPRCPNSPVKGGGTLIRCMPKLRAPTAVPSISVLRRGK